MHLFYVRVEIRVRMVRLQHLGTNVIGVGLLSFQVMFMELTFTF